MNYHNFLPKLRWVFPIIVIVIGCKPKPSQAELQAESAYISHPYCTGYCSVQSLLDINTPSLGIINYNYRFVRGDNSQPTIIFLPGGPGLKSTDDPYNLIDLGYSTILTDPRTVGVNAHISIPNSEDHSWSKNIANDVLQIIKQRELSNYIVYAVSYGTIVATILADLIAKENSTVNSPKALLLEGTLGRAFHRGEGVKGFYDQWDTVRSAIPPRFFIELENSNPFNLGLSEAQWGRAIFLGLVVGKYNLTMALSALVSDEIKMQKKGKHYINLLIQLEEDPVEKTEIYKMIGCSEIMHDYPDFPLYPYLEFSTGNLKVSTSKNICATIPFSKPFDAKEFTVNSPIYYINGKDDPSTPLWQAQYHYDNIKTESKKFFYTVNSGHGPVSMETTANHALCKKSVLNAVSQLQNLNEIIHICGQY